MQFSLFFFHLKIWAFVQGSVGSIKHQFPDDAYITKTLCNIDEYL